MNIRRREKTRVNTLISLNFDGKSEFPIKKWEVSLENRKIAIKYPT